MGRSFHICGDDLKAISLSCFHFHLLPMKISFELNGLPMELETDGDQPLLWLLRDQLDLKGSKFGCGKAACGACTVLLDGQAVRSCSYPARLINEKRITTIEGLASGSELHPLQQAWMEEIVPQCGYCQSGMIMAAAALLENHPNPSDEDIDNGIQNICRCGTYYRARKAIHRAAAIMTELQSTNSSVESNE